MALPTCMMPMATKIWRLAWHGHNVPRCWGNNVVAPGADVLLHRLVWLHTSHLYFAVQPIPNIHVANRETPTREVQVQ